MTFISPIGLPSSPGNTGLTGYVHVLNAPAGTPVTIDIPELGVKATVRTTSDGNAPFTAKASKLTLVAGNP